MKNKFLIGLTIILCLVLMATPVMAAGGSAAVSSAAGKPGSTVYLTVSISGFEDADALSISVSGALPLDAANSSWLRSSALSDFSGNAGVWANTSGAGDLNGDIAKLAFTVPTPEVGQTDLDYSISVTVRVKNDTESLGEATASGRVTIDNPATNITVTPGTLELTLGSTETADLAVEVTPANTTDKVVWSSSDNSVATVEGGKVTAHKGGTAVITATAGSLSQTCRVTVICPHPNVTETPAKDATCTAAGNKQYWTCDDCGAVLDADKKPSSLDAQILPQLAHSYGTSWTTDANSHYHLCTGCKTAKADEAAHDFKEKIDKAATETETGLKHEECSVCGLKRNENTVIAKLDHAHTGVTQHVAVAATCTKQGNVEYWTCSSSLCAGKYYGDAKCQLALTTVVTEIDEKNHVGATEVKDAVAATCHKEGYSGDTYCLDCKEMIKAGEVLAATGKHTAGTEWKSDDKAHWHLCTTDGCDALVDKAEHTFVWKTDKKATEVETGLKHEECSVCGVVRSKDTVIEKLKHYPKYVEGKAPTCTEEGLLEHYHCGNCGGYYACENNQAGKRITKADTVLAATGHIFDNEWVYDEESHWRFCDCGEMSEKEAHTTELTGQTEASETAEGYTGDEVCTVCQSTVKQGEVIPCVTVPTEAATKAPTEVPTEAPAIEEPEEEESGNWLLVVAALAAVGAVGTGIVVPIIKKKRK